MKTYILILISLLSLSSFAKSSPAPEPCTNEKQFIFLIHGIGGGKSTFGSMEDYLNKNFSCFVVQSFIYETGKNGVDTHLFARNLNEFVINTLEQKKAEPHDRVSLIMHSQGGLVGSLWLHDIQHSNSNLFNKVDAFISLATPYWGASVAGWGGHVFYTLPEDKKNPISPFGRTELREMAYGSSTIKELEGNFKTVFGNSHIRAMALGGLKTNFGPHLGEDDSAVSVYSSRPDHYILQTDVDLNQPMTPVAQTDFQKTNYVPYIPVRATHVKLDLPGIANIPKKCLETESGR